MYRKEKGRLNKVILNDHLTWDELTEEFINFLQGNGYVLQGIDVANYLSHQYKFQNIQEEYEHKIQELEKQVEKLKNKVKKQGKNK